MIFIVVMFSILIFLNFESLELEFIELEYFEMCVILKKLCYGICYMRLSFFLKEGIFYRFMFCKNVYELYKWKYNDGILFYLLVLLSKIGFFIRKLFFKWNKRMS